MPSRQKTVVALLSLSAALLSGPVLAAGTINGITVSSNNIQLSQSLTADVKGIAQLDQFGKGCAIRVSMKYADNSVEVPHPHLLASMFPSTGFYLKPSKAGKVIVTADGGTGSPSGWPACQGSASTEITVTAPIIANPNIQVRPTGVVSLPPGALELPQLTSIKQVQYTEHSGETWIEVQGKGNCNFTIEGNGVPPQSFASSAAKPFPMKVKIQGAPLGFHNWTAKGTGNCTGQATTGFSVD